MIFSRFPKEKLHTVDNSHDAVTLLRLLSRQKRKRHVLCCEQRPHLLVDRMEYVGNADDSQLSVRVCSCLVCAVCGLYGDVSS